MPIVRSENWKRGRGSQGLRAIGLAFVIAVGLASQGGARAQIAPGFSGSSTTTHMNGDEALRTLTAFGSCYATRQSADAFALIGTEPGSRAEAETYRRLFRRDSQACLGEGTDLAMPVAFVRGAIAEGLYKNGVSLPAHLAQSAPAPGAPIRRFSEAARCYTAAHRERTRALVETTPPGSRRELAALNQLAPDFFRCLPESAWARRLPPTQIRFLLAEALLRLPPAAAGQR